MLQRVIASLSLFAAASALLVAGAAGPASGATATLTNFVQVNNSMEYDVEVTLTSGSSSCYFVTFHFTRLGGGGPEPYNVPLYFVGPGTDTAHGEAGLLASGRYDCWGNAFGYTGYLPWNAASNHHEATVP